MQFCPKCGAAWRQNARFCTNCGYRLGTDATAPGAGFLDASAAPEQQRKKKQRPPMSGGARAWRVLVSVILCMILFPALLGGMGLASARIASSRLAITAAVQMVDVETAYFDDVSVTIADELFDALDPGAVSGYGITKEDVVRFVNSSTLRTFLSGVAGDFVSDYLTGNGNGVLTADDVVDFIYDNADVIEKELGYPIGESDRALLHESAVTALGGEEVSIRREFGDDEDWSLRLVRGVFSYGSIAACFAVALACAVGMYFLWRGYFFAFSRMVGVPLVLAGILYLLTAVGMLLLPSLLHAMEGYSRNLLNAMLFPGGIGIGLMALIAILIGAFLMAIGTRKRKALRADSDKSARG